MADVVVLVLLLVVVAATVVVVVVVIIVVAASVLPTKCVTVTHLTIFRDGNRHYSRCHTNWGPRVAIGSTL